MNKKSYSKFYSILLALILLISLVTTPLSAIVHAETENDDAVDNVTVEGQEDTEENETNHEDIEESEENESIEEDEESDNTIVEENNAEKIDVAAEESKELDDEQPKAEVVIFEDDTLHQEVESALGIYDRDITVSDMEELEELNIQWSTYSHIKSLKGLEHAVNLKTLSMFSHEVEDLTPLANLTKLTELDLRGNEIISLSPLENLTNLTKLDVGVNNISDLSPLASLTNLTELIADRNEITDLSPLAKLTNLTTLHMYNVLDMGRNRITDLTPLANLTKLADLDLWGNKVSDLSPLAKLTNLAVLDVRENEVSNLTPLANLTNLTELNASQNNITDLSPLANLTNLTELDVSFNEISDLSSLMNLNKLIALSVDGNYFTKLPSFKNLESLERLYMSDNRVTDLSNLAGLKNLKDLWFVRNNVTNLSVLKELPKLEVVILLQNKIEDKETIKWLRNEGVEVHDDQENSYGDGFLDLKDIFPVVDGFEAKANVIYVNLDQSSKEKLTLNTKQINKLAELKLSKYMKKMVLTKGGTTTSIPASVFVNAHKNNETIEIEINALEKEINSFSKTYDFIIKQGHHTISQLDDSMTLTFKVNTDRAKNLNNLKVFYKNETTGKWENIGGLYNANNGTVSVQTKSFGTFTVFEAKEKDSDDIVEVEDESDKGEGSTGSKPEENVVKETFPASSGFKVNEAAAQVTVDTKDAPVNLSKEQVQVLVDNNLTIVLVKDGVTTSIPASVFTSDGEVVITIEVLDKVAHSFSNAYKFTIRQGKETISEFEEAISLTFNVNVEGADNVANLQVFYFNETTGNWENIGGKYDPKAGTVTATTNHFSTFAVFEAEAIDSDDIVVKDNESSEQEEKSEDPVIENDDNASTGVASDKDATSLLPKTATNTYNLMFFGLALLLAGGSIFAMRCFSSKRA